MLSVKTTLRGQSVGSGRHSTVDLPCSLVDHLANLCGGSLEGVSVLEPGPWEGHYTVDMLDRGASVTAIDGRKRSLFATGERVRLHGVSAANLRLVRGDVRGDEFYDLLGQHDACFHSNVLMHLEDPVEHLRRIGESDCRAVLFYAHVATEALVSETFKGHDVQVKNDWQNSPWVNGGIGVRRSRRLMLVDACGILEAHGRSVEVVSTIPMKGNTMRAIWSAVRR